ncbi:hypothetical protein [Peribacillus butanolivorans]
MSKVSVWVMTEEERLAYIKKYPIVPMEKPRKSGSFTNIHTYGNRRKKSKGGEKNGEGNKIFRSGG